MDHAFQTKRLTLRPAQAADLEPLHAVFRDPDVMRYWDRPAHALKDTEAFLNGFINAPSDTREEYILEYQGQCVGKAGLWKPHELGYILRKDLWGQGLITEACAAILPRAWRKFADAQQITAELDPRNTGSIRVLEKLGFRMTGITEKNFLYGGTEWCDTGYFVLDRPKLQ